LHARNDARGAHARRRRSDVDRHKLPPIFGLDPAGVVVEVGNQVIGVKPVKRVYAGQTRGHCVSQSARRLDQ
jgi:NADPH:quinone reductase-like Zn-dependent oxidoreductase